MKERVDERPSVVEGKKCRHASVNLVRDRNLKEGGEEEGKRDKVGRLEQKDALLFRAMP